MERFIEEIEIVKEEFVAAFASGDVSKFNNIYDINGEILMDGGLVIRGVEEITIKIKKFLDLIGPSIIEAESLDYWEHGDVVYEKGKFLLRNPKTKKVFHTGCYMIIWKVQRDGTYRIYREIKMDIVG